MFILFYVFCVIFCIGLFFFFKQKTAYEMRISDWSSDVCSSEATEIGFDVVEVDSRGSGLDQDAHRLAAEPHRAGQDPGADGHADGGVDPAPAGEVDEQAAGDHPDAPDGVGHNLQVGALDVERLPEIGRANV